MPRRAHFSLLAWCATVAAIVLTIGATSAAAGPGWTTIQTGVKRGKARPPQPRMKWPTHGQTVSGRVKWRVAVNGARARRIDLAVDGVVRARLVGRKADRRGGRLGRNVSVAMLDTTKLSNGRHRLTAIAYGYRPRRPRRSFVKVTVANPTHAETPATPEAPVTPQAPATPPNGPGSIYWGAWIGNQLTGTEAPWDMGAVSRLEGMVGKQLSLIHFAAPFANCASQPCTYYSFPTTPLNDVRRYGAIPFFSWSSQAIPGRANQPDYQLSDVIAGRHDAHIRYFAEAARDWGHPFFLRFNWEMNADWFAWGERANGNRPGEYVAAWRHVHDIFAAAGAENVTWVWCPHIDPHDQFQGLASLYPGDSYVDWTCVDGYNWGTNPAAPRGWRSFDQQFRSTYEEIVRIAPTKPMAIGEVGSSEFGGSKAAWIRDMLARVPAYSKVRAVLWFEKFDDGMDWPLETSDAAVGAFASGIQSSVYTTNSYGDLGVSPIPPPGS
jgi:hypothetical protein